MNANTQKLHTLGQSLWIDNITREMLDDGTMARYIAELSVTGLTSNPTIFEHAIGTGNFYDAQIGELTRQGKSGEDLFFALALQDLTRAADLFRPVHDATGGVDGWVSLEVSPIGCFLRTVPAAVLGIVFLSGGQSSELASIRLNAMNVKFKGRMPWALAFSFARAIQQPALEIWRGQAANASAAQKALFHRADCNRAARCGEYDAATDAPRSRAT